MTKYYIDIEWSRLAGTWRWTILEDGHELVGQGVSAFRWLAKRRAINRLLDIKASKDMAEKMKDKSLSYEVELL